MTKHDRIDVYLRDPEIHRRVRQVAAGRRMHISDWCREAILDKLSQEEESPVSTPDEFADTLRRLHEQILAERNGAPFTDLDVLLDEVRQDREDVILGLR